MPEVAAACGNVTVQEADAVPAEDVTATAAHPENTAGDGDDAEAVNAIVPVGETPV